MKREIKLKIQKLGKKKLIIYLPKAIRNNNWFDYGEIITLEIRKDNKRAVSISKFHYLLSLKKDIVSLLDLKEGDVINVKINKIINQNKSFKLFYKDNIDLLFLSFILS